MAKLKQQSKKLKTTLKNLWLKLSTKVTGKTVWQLDEGHVKKPQMSYTLDEKRKPVKYFLSEDDVMDVRDFLSTLHRGRPRKDGLVTSKDVPTKQELRAKIKNETILYQQTEDGDYIPVWKQPEW